MLRRSASRTALAGALVAVAALITAGCTPSSPTDPPSTAAPLPTSTASPGEPGGPDVDPSEPAPEFVEGGSAADNAPFARFVVQQGADAVGERPSSAQVADALSTGGFDRAALEVTADRTPLGMATDVISFAVRIDDDCIIGEVRGTAVTTTVVPALATGRCLVGADASID
ncbi:hypothetical protein EV140_1896 [Microcella alkaliphila]|uniref:DUF6993 domain-containing protein n=1 Tax=Microcella alkaliphila TaxID=279828 RepID=A0A4Q7TJ62_9MICO|nr:hypothetical protein [Microcella alkaliphila]RZT59292.1 hypothetical protein EV140_1896 [Microcella alkaliphila]